ncbi:hypothetical protein CANARDRAFT_28324 [[Candida] arabinofermentans NRRL YB-2248]|uniref:Ion transport domain-containing protein n=1 Tax=[Candida] arabinofermentans NRRL YB-2248 TaxID=983967 RepID=A0A1E4T1F9_9ASCO|nr:hypothetical protein CANARDRAFT_28324 [[Candida] arabinofermentans NRRL YB-2248]
MSRGDISLPVYEDEECNDYSAPSPRQVLRIAINLKDLIDKIIPIPLSEEAIAGQDSIILNDKVMKAVREAAGGTGAGKGSSAKRYQACLIFCLLKVSSWYFTLAINELSDDTLYQSRMLAAEKIAANLIESETDDKYLFLSMLCHRYSINLHDVDSDPENALELAVDMHSTLIIASGGYQRCIKWLWRGWIVQSSTDSADYALYKGTGNSGFWYHFDPDRLRTPLYQNILEILFSIIYLIIYTIIVNSDTARKISVLEILYYLFTIGFVADEMIKFYHVGYYYIMFSNAFNGFMYGLIVASMVLRFLALSKSNPELGADFDIMSYRILSLAAPFMWIRLLLYLDVIKFVGAMMVVIKKMMKESFIFFFLLGIIMIGFLQAFLGLDQADGKRDLTTFVMTTMVQTVLSGPDFSAVERFAYPYGIVLYYAFTFIVLLVLLNILIALYSQAYADVVENSTDEYLAQYSSKILKYVRAPDDKIFCPPLNLIEIVFLDIPLKWFLDKRTFDNICDKVMTVIYTPALLFIASYEVKIAKRVTYNRSKRLPDDENELDVEWDLTDGFNEDDEDGHQVRDSLRLQRRAENEDPSFSSNFKSWSKKIDELVPPIVESKSAGVSWETYQIFSKIDALNDLVSTLVEQNKELKEKLEKKD